MVQGVLEDGIWMEPAPGHTPGHVTINVKAEGREAIMSGDMLHHPILFLERELVNLGDWNPDMAAASRARLLARCADNSGLLHTMHFPTPTAGTVTRQGSGNHEFLKE